MAKITPNYEMKNDSDLSKFLLGAIRDVRKNELDVDKAHVISQLADKYTKNEIMQCIKVKLRKQNDRLDIGSEINKALLNNIEGSDEDDL